MYHTTLCTYDVCKKYFDSPLAILVLFLYAIAMVYNSKNDWLLADSCLTLLTNVVIK